MKPQFFKNSLILTFAFLMLFSSCLKDDRYIDYSKVGTLIELPLAAYNPNNLGYKLLVKTYPQSPTPAELPVVINVASPEPLGTDLKVTLAVDAAALANYNTANSKSFIILPSVAYTVSSLQSIISAGTRTTQVVFKINTAVIDKTITNYVLPVTLVDASGEKISNYKTVYYNIKVI